MVDQTTIDCDQFRSIIVSALAEHPDWLHAALTGVSVGMSAALHIANQKRGQADRAMLAALILGGEKRVTSTTREMMNKIICEAINPDCASPIEREYLAKGGLNG